MFSISFMVSMHYFTVVVCLFFSPFRLVCALKCNSSLSFALVYNAVVFPIWCFTCIALWGNLLNRFPLVCCHCFLSVTIQFSYAYLLFSPFVANNFYDFDFVIARRRLLLPSCTVVSDQREGGGQLLPDLTSFRSSRGFAAPSELDSVPGLAA